MNWNKLKTFLIVLFSALNIILIITMLTKDYKETVVPESTIQDTVDVLGKRGISIDRKIIPDRAKNMEGFMMQTIDFAHISDKVSYLGGGEFEINLSHKAASLKDVKTLLAKMGIQYAKFQGDTKDITKIKNITKSALFCHISN